MAATSSKGTNEIDLSAPRLLIVGGNTSCGKSVFVKYLIQKNMLKKNPTWDKIILLSPTCKMQDTYNFLPREWMKDKFDLDEEIELLLSEQEHPKYRQRRVLLIIDDIISMVSNSKPLERLAVSGRHFNITTMILAQHLKSVITPVIRSNCAYLICGKINDSSKQSLVENISYPGWRKADKEEFVSNAFRIPFNFIVVNNMPHGDELFTCKINIKNLKKNFRINLK